MPMGGVMPLALLAALLILAEPAMLIVAFLLWHAIHCSLHS
jgi:hypothetical protein